MHAYLITGRDKNEINKSISRLVNKLKAKRLDFEVAKIADVRDLGRFTNLALSEKTAVVIKSLEEASEEAQNAFLKALEEPQRNLVYIVTAKDTDLLLPTIASRCSVIQTPSTKHQILNKSQIQINKFLNASVGEKLEIVSKITKREEAVEFLTSLILNTQPQLTKNPNLAYLLESASQALAAINANGNVSLQLTNFVINYKKGRP
ncbi:hypothetical protein A2630_02835 [Candidatus Woesebacteria bacterium RIFCSPHIGHO2_01_FULL_44_10]|uniref:DNA polymerase III delta N-terminal domain-containing protein n=1 Tax=Candidatus Woesebacteria bacterium RIFCSPLOWO2_01_FULL_44_14 TaxID=1802525 RepID=A0A1F8C4B5_9BACT|nr:MAG: hypothetical protein A2630_02835 [Candidatus Woesebacteria bacterium RIFCSPHIGHO2_01_FULL_44_10]OGM55720.1 MAG: hypothetical protein A3F62_04530 [Candidatus Woesebacteria bacterium RIFCSPHIGHO2_12_FULL_44_11]OGM70505.1 MAG: hypothetical protein A2975_01865 [Candidatus Woesebacteria bacterium RIFCSPLOWO2_01_FULL_44_14]